VIMPKKLRDQILAALQGDPPAVSGAEPKQYPIQLTAEQEEAVKEWAADDRLWTTQDTVEFNLRTFARTILQHASPESSNG
jgi:hypothetical protein